MFSFDDFYPFFIMFLYLIQLPGQASINYPTDKCLILRSFMQLMNREPQRLTLLLIGCLSFCVAKVSRRLVLNMWVPYILDLRGIMSNHLSSWLNCSKDIIICHLYLASNVFLIHFFIFNKNLWLYATSSIVTWFVNILTS